MPKLSVLKTKEVIKRFEKLGFIIYKKWNQSR